MATNWAERVNRNTDEDNRVVLLQERRATPAPGSRPAARSGRAVAQIHRLAAQFTATDRASIVAWADDPSHGYARLQVEQGMRDDGGWEGYALVYMPGQAWSAWGVRRRDKVVEVWRCADGKTVSRHDEMADALASLPHATVERRASSDLHRKRRGRAEPSARIGHCRPRDPLPHTATVLPG